MTGKTARGYLGSLVSLPLGSRLSLGPGPPGPSPRGRGPALTALGSRRRGGPSPPRWGSSTPTTSTSWVSGDPGDTIDTVSAGLLYGRSSPRSRPLGLRAGLGKPLLELQPEQPHRLRRRGRSLLQPLTDPVPHLRAGGELGLLRAPPHRSGCPVPGVRADSLRTNAAADWQATPRTRLRIDGDVGYLHYASEISDLDPSELPLDALVLAGVVSPEQAEIGIEDLPTPIDSSLVALRALSAEGVRGGSLNLLTFRGGVVLTQNLSPRS